ncbi:MAG: extracellular solute-binding protein [Chloroflexota bacterium]
MVVQPVSSLRSVSRRRVLGLTALSVGVLPLFAACGSSTATTSAATPASVASSSTVATATTAALATSAAATSAVTSATAPSTNTASSSSTLVASTASVQAAQATLKIAVGEGGQSQAVQWDPIWAAWQKLHPEFKTDVNSFPGASVDQYREKVITLLAGGETFDNLYFHHVISGEFMGHSLLRPIDSYIAQNASAVNTADYSPYLLKIFSWNGKQYGLPQEANPWTIWYNADLFAKEGLPPPTTLIQANKWDWTTGFLDVAKSATHKGGDTPTWGYGGYGNGQGYWGWTYWLPPVWSNGGDLWTSDFMHLALDQPPALEALQYWADLSGKDAVAPPQDQGKQWDQTSGNLAMGSFAPFTVPNFDKFHWKAGMVVNPGGSAAGAFYASGTSAFGISTVSKNPDTAWKWCQWICTEGVKIWLDHGFFTAPPRKSLATYPGWVNSRKPWEDVDMWAKATAAIRLPPAIPGWTIAINALSKELDQALLGKQTMKEAIAKVKAPVDAILQQAVAP